MVLRSLLPLLTTLLVVAAPAGAQSLIVVDAAGGPGSHFTDLPAAVAAAVSGDHLLLRDGTYAGFTLSGKALDVEAETSAAVGPVVIEDLRPGGAVVLRGLELAGGASPALTVHGCEGAVLVQECALTADGDAAVVTDSASVTFVRSFVQGGAGATGGDGHRGLVASGSFVSTHGGAFVGGDGGAAGCSLLDVDGGAGGDGGDVRGGFLFSGASDWMGGSGGDACETASLGCFAAGGGGHGLDLAPDASGLELSGGALCGGPGGAGAGCCCGDGPEGDGWTGALGFANQDPRLLEVFSPVQAGSLTILSLFGEEGDSALVAVGDLGPATFLPGLHGVLGIPAPWLVFAVGPTPGHVALPAAVPDIAPLPFARVAVQALFLAASGDRVLSGVSRLTIVP